MVLLESKKIPLGTRMPDFTLKDPNGKALNGDDLYGEAGLIVVFTCNHCPYAKAVWGRLIRIAKYASSRGINTVAINPNIHPEYPEDAPDKMAGMIERRRIDFPYLIDESQKTARAFNAECTPDIYLYDKGHRLVYHGRIDDNWKDEKMVRREDLKEAVENLAGKRPISDVQYPSMGCSIKWRSN